jgi:hypothetical protein
MRTLPDSDFAINFDDDLLKNDEEFIEWVSNLAWDDIKHLADEIKRPQPEPDYENEWQSTQKSIVKWEESFSIFDFFEINDTMSEEDSDDDRSV